MFVCLCVCGCVWVSVCVCVCTDTHAHTHTHTRTRINCVQGVLDMEVYRAGKRVWSGTVARGVGEPDTDFFTDIPLVEV